MALWPADAKPHSIKGSEQQKTQDTYNVSAFTILSVKGQIEVEFKHEYETINLKNYEVISHNNNMAVLKNKPEIVFNTKDFVNEISKDYEIVDFSVKSIGVDEILAKLYTELDL